MISEKDRLKRKLDIESTKQKIKNFEKTAETEDTFISRLMTCHIVAIRFGGDHMLCRVKAVSAERVVLNPINWSGSSILVYDEETLRIREAIIIGTKPPWWLRLITFGAKKVIYN